MNLCRMHNTVRHIHPPGNLSHFTYPFSLRIVDNKTDDLIAHKNKYNQKEPIPSMLLLNFSDQSVNNFREKVTIKRMAGHSFEDELKPDAEANRIISDSDLINIDIKELNKMLKERGIAKVNRLI